MARPNTDDPLDRWLARTLTSGDATTGEVCPEPDLLAAFVDGSLDRPERGSIERHASSCSRCAQILAATEASAQTPVAPPLSSIWTSWRAWRWAVPMATAVTVVGVWLAASRPGTPPVTGPATENGSPALQTAPTGNAMRQRAPEQKQAGSESEPRAADALEMKSLARGDLDSRTSASPPAAVASPPPAAAPASQVARLDRVAPEAASQPPKDAAQADARRNEEAAPERRRSDQSAGLAAAVDTAVVLVRTTDPNLLWRARAGAIERSEDGGTTWRLERVVSGSIVAGSSPMPDVVWLFARSGLVVRRTQAGWAESKAPAGAEIVSIRATSGDRATIGLADGRTFETTDGGASWKAR